MECQAFNFYILIRIENQVHQEVDETFFKISLEFYEKRHTIKLLLR